MANTKLSVILAKNEATRGIDPTPTPGANAIAVRNLKMEPAGEIIERILNRGSFSQFPHVLGARWYEATFDVELKGSGTANAGGVADVPEIDPLLRSAGFGVTLTAESGGGVGDGKIEYDPVSTSLETVTIYGYFDGVLKKMHYGFVNSFRFDATAGNPGKIDMSVIGLYARPTDTVTPGGLAFNSTRPPLFENANLVIDGAWSPEFDKFSLDAGLEIAKRKDANTAGALKGFEMTGRAITGSIDPAQELEATHPIHQKWEDAETMAFTSQVGNTAGNIIEITSPSVQYREIKSGDREGLATYEVPLTFSSDVGDNEVKFTFK